MTEKCDRFIIMITAWKFPEQFRYHKSNPENMKISFKDNFSEDKF